MTMKITMTQILFVQKAKNQRRPDIQKFKHQRSQKARNVGTNKKARKPESQKTKKAEARKPEKLRKQTSQTKIM